METALFRDLSDWEFSAYLTDAVAIETQVGDVSAAGPDILVGVSRLSIELRPSWTETTWYWSDAWQQMEAQADKDLAEGNYRDFDSIEELFTCLDGPE